MEIQERAVIDGVISLALNTAKDSSDKLTSLLSNPSKIDLIINDKNIADLLSFENIQKVIRLNNFGFEKAGLIVFNVVVSLNKDEGSDKGVMSGLLIPTDSVDVNYIVHWLSIPFKDNQTTDTIYVAAQCWSFIEHKYNKLVINANVKSSLVERATMDSYRM